MGQLMRKGKDMWMRGRERGGEGEERGTLCSRAAIWTPLMTQPNKPSKAKNSIRLLSCVVCAIK